MTPHEGPRGDLLWLQVLTPLGTILLFCLPHPGPIIYVTVGLQYMRVIN